MSVEETLAFLEPRIGREIRVSEWLEMTQARIDEFAGATGDRQWIHVDPRRAREESPFGATIAHGYLVLSLYPFLRGQAGGDAPPFPGVTSMLNYGLDRLRFPNPVRAGDRIRGRFSLLSVERAGAGLQVVERFTVEVEGAEKPSCVADVVRRLLFD